MILRGFLLLLLASLASPMGKTRTRDSRGRGRGTVEVVRDRNTSRVTMQCLGDVFVANWSKDGSELQPSKRVVISAEYVTIYPLLPQDEGEYRCNSGQTPLSLTSKSYTTQHTHSLSLPALQPHLT